MVNISKVTCWPMQLQGKYFIDWQCESNEDITFDVLYSREEDGIYTFAATQVVPGVEVHISEISLNFVDDLFFIVDAISKDTGKSVYRSTPINSAYIPERTHYLRHREMLRRTQLDIERYIGARFGFLLRRKTYGAIAKNVNPILGMPIGEEDENAFGEKFDGGYLPAVKMFCGYIQGERGDENTTIQEVGMTDVRKLQLLIMPYPIVTTYDIWVDGGCNDRYIILSPIKVPSFRDLAVKQIPVIQLLPRSDRAYEIPIT